eukprot:gene9740-29483_t
MRLVCLAVLLAACGPNIAKARDVLCGTPQTQDTRTCKCLENWEYNGKDHNGCTTTAQHLTPWCYLDTECKGAFQSRKNHSQWYADCTLCDANGIPYSDDHFTKPKPTTSTTVDPVAMRIPPVDGNSRKTCAALGWDYDDGLDVQIQDGVCASSFVGGACTGKVSFAAAYKACDDVGARLCSFDELKHFGIGNRVHKYSKCKPQNNAFFWSDETEPCGAGEHWMWSKNNHNKCKPDDGTNNNYLVCCADVVAGPTPNPNAIVPTGAPDESTTTTDAPDEKPEPTDGTATAPATTTTTTTAMTTSISSTASSAASSASSSSSSLGTSFSTSATSRAPSSATSAAPLSRTSAARFSSHTTHATAAAPLAGTTTLKTASPSPAKDDGISRAATVRTSAALWTVTAPSALTPARNASHSVGGSRKAKTRTLAVTIVGVAVLAIACVGAYFHFFVLGKRQPAGFPDVPTKDRVGMLSVLPQTPLPTPYMHPGGGSVYQSPAFDGRDEMAVAERAEPVSDC